MRDEQYKILNFDLLLNIFFCFRAKFILPDSSNDENTNDDNPNDKEHDENEDMKDDGDDGVTGQIVARPKCCNIAYFY